MIKAQFNADDIKTLKQRYKFSSAAHSDPNLKVVEDDKGFHNLLKEAGIHKGDIWKCVKIWEEYVKLGRWTPKEVALYVLETFMNSVRASDIRIHTLRKPPTTATKLLFADGVLKHL